MSKDSGVGKKKEKTETTRFVSTNVLKDEPASTSNTGVFKIPGS